MTEPTADSSLPLEQWQAIAEKSQRLMRDFVARQGDGVGQNDDMKRMNDVFMQATMQLLSDPCAKPSDNRAASPVWGYTLIESRFCRNVLPVLLGEAAIDS